MGLYCNSKLKQNFLKKKQNKTSFQRKITQHGKLCRATLPHLCFLLRSSSTAAYLTWTFCPNPSPLCYWEVLVPSMSVIPSLSGSLVCLVLNIFLVSSDLILPLLVIDIVTPTLSSDSLRTSLYVGAAWGALWGGKQLAVKNCSHSVFT